jgi:hypothetical protein
MKKKIARVKRMPRGIISGPPLESKLHIDSTWAGLAGAVRVSACKKISNI